MAAEDDPATACATVSGAGCAEQYATSGASSSAVHGRPIKTSCITKSAQRAHVAPLWRRARHRADAANARARLNRTPGPTWLTSMYTFNVFYSMPSPFRGWG